MRFQGGHPAGEAWGEGIEMCSSDKAPEPICNPEWNAPDWNGGGAPRLAPPHSREQGEG
jgi:hypothetical protein